MKTKLYSFIILAVLSGNLSAFSQSVAPIDFDIRGRDCSGGLGLCSANKTSSNNNTITVQKTSANTFVLTFLRSSLSEAEERSIAGQPFSALQSQFPTTFTQSGDLKFSKEVVNALGLETKYNLLKKGSYPMQIEEHTVVLTLTLTEGS